MILILLLLLVWMILSIKEGYYNSPLIYDHYVENKNNFGNYYRVGSELSHNLGWKPSTKWDHLQPQNNECAQCFPKD